MTRLCCACLMLFSLALAPAGDPATESFVRGEKHFKAQEWEEALGAFRGFLLDNPKHARAPEARYFAGLCLAETDEPDQAIELLDAFLTEHAGSVIADKALARLGELYRDQEQYERAREVWTTFVAKHQKSSERERVNDMLIDLLIQKKKDHEAAFRECARALHEYEELVKQQKSAKPAETDKPNADPPEQPEHPCFMGAYCLTTLHREKEAEAWIGKYFAEPTASNSAVRAVLGIASKLANHHDDEVLRGVDGLFEEYDDIGDADQRADIREKLCFVLRSGGKYDRARQLVIDELKKPAIKSEEQVDALFDMLSEIIDEANDLDLRDSLTLLAAPGVPALTRAKAIDRLVDDLREEEDDKAELTLRRLVSDDASSFIRVRAGIKLASLLADDHEDRHSAVRVLKDLLPKTTRPDLIHTLNEAIKEYDEAEPAK